MTGEKIYDLCKELFPINRSLTGNGVRETFDILKRELPELKIYEVPTGTKCFDWTIPKEWNIKEAYIIDPDGNKICDFNQSNLHVVGYSIPIKVTMSLKELDKYLYSLPEQPDAIPYVTSYYKERWGFCLTQNQRDDLKNGEYTVFIDSNLDDGYLTYGELILNGQSDKEVLLSTYICHPSMANNELSGPVVTTFIAKWLKTLDRKYTYRILFIPETIGSIMYLSKHYKHMKEKIIAGFVLTCIGDDRNYSILRSRGEDTLADKVAIYAASQMSKDYKEYSFLERGSDERQYCSPGIDLPVVNLMRTKYGEYPEYHTSLDNFDVVTPEGLKGGYDFVKVALNTLELNEKYQTQVLCEPQLGKRGLYPTTNTKNQKDHVRVVTDLIAYSDGKHSLLDISEKCGHSIAELNELAKKLVENKLLKKEEKIY